MSRLSRIVDMDGRPPKACHFASHGERPLPSRWYEVMVMNQCSVVCSLSERPPLTDLTLRSTVVV